MTLLRIFSIGIILIIGVMHAVFSQSTESPAVLDPFLERKLSQDELLHFYYADDAELSDYEADERYSIVIYGDENSLNNLPVHINSRLNGFATANLTFEELYDISRLSGITMLEMGAEMDITLDESLREINADLVHEGQGLNTSYTGDGVIIGIIDTGIDIFHPDFRDAENNLSSRIVSIWDTELQAQDVENPPEAFNYGVEFTREDIEADLADGTRNRVRSIDSNGHGTHVAGTAGGNGENGDGQFTGVAPEAEFIIVAFPNGRFSPGGIIDGINYIFQIADERGKPAVINLSLGGHGGAHDGRAPQEQAIDEFFNKPGRAVVVSAGNSGTQEIHTGGVPVAGNSTTTFSLDVSHAMQDNEGGNNLILNLLWYESDQNIVPNATLTVTTPNDREITVSSLDRDTLRSDDGTIVVADFSQSITDPETRVFLIEITNNNTIPPARGNWNFELRNLLDVASFTYNMWIVSTSLNGGSAEAVPNTGRRFTVSIPGTARSAITVGAYTTKRKWRDTDGLQRGIEATADDLASFSSGGPTRDGRLKPEISAPGQVIVAPFSDDANAPSFLRTETDGYRIMQGTSMSAPHVTGIIALMMEANPALTSEQIREIVKQTGREDSFATGLPNNDWGYGKVNALDAINETMALVNIVDRDNNLPDQFTLHQNYPNPFNPETRIMYSIPWPEKVTLTVYNTIGQRIATLIDKVQEAGLYEAVFNASHLPSGVYIYRLQAGNHTESKQMVLLR